MEAACASLLRVATIVAHVNGGLVVEVAAQEGCEQCARGRGCGVGLLARQRSRQLVVALPRAASVDTDQAVEQCYPLGQQVTISLPRTSVTLLAFFVYAFPLMAALLLAGLVPLVSTALWLAPLVFFATLIMCAISMKVLLRERSERFRPRLVC
ncbi:SoxR reducing system RseC family protein [Halomonas sp. FME1]|uniref:SoxR reducing system RseC family protein n=1 Tax=Halomonas casei TaxID=2742613 RepID=A0ABR9F4X4_9GAMM|nr:MULTISPECIES: SoxR reducing system RseC family protein [Halomonas]MBE0401545.1 SoxR reducing system RseC family protein [Halomonas casei]PCC22780.1 Fis family transcriptional regulator [Halomonas sp. JB37]